MKQKEAIRSLWTPTAGMLTGARRAAMLLLTTLLLTLTAQTAWAQTYTVSFDKCEGEGGNDGVTATLNEQMPDISVPTREGFTFGGYFTDRGGVGTQYYDADGKSTNVWDKEGDATLYAMWTTDRINIKVLFTWENYGSNLDDEVLEDYEKSGLSVKVNGQSVSREINYYPAVSQTGQKNTISVSLPSSIYALNATYSYVNSEEIYQDGVQMSYEGGKYQWSFTIADNDISSQERNVTIRINIGNAETKYIVFFDANGGTGEAMKYLIMDPSSTDNLPVCTFLREDYTFKGWATSTSGSRQYDDGAEITAGDQGGTLTLYAKWSNNEAPEDETYTVTFDANGGTGDDMSPQTFTVDVAQNLSACSYTRVGYTFDGWSTTQNGDVAYTDEQEVSGLASEGVTVMLYAHWKANTYYVQFNGNGNTSGLMERESFTYDAPAKKLTANAFTREGYAFSGWNTAADGSGSSYENEAVVNNLTSEADGIVELYAHWKKQLTNDNITIEIPAQTYNGSELTPVVTVYDNDSEVSDEHYTVTLPEGRTNAGDYLITITAEEGSTILAGSYTKKFTISKAPLTVAANDRSIFYGNAAANNGVTYSGFVNDEGENVLGGELTYTYSNAKGAYGEGNDALGEYDITPGGLTSDNYAITFVPGKLTVNPVTVKVSVVDKADKQPIVGNLVVVRNSNGVIIHDWYSTSTEENHIIKGIKAGGEYTIMGNEYMGYTRSAEYTLTIDENGNVSSYSGTKTEDGVLLVENSKTKVEISVVDITTKEPISGATVQVLDGNGNVVKDLEDNNVEWTSDGSTHTIEGLKTNVEYTLHETVAPNRYAAPADYKFTIDPNGRITFTGNSTEDGVLLVENTKTGDLIVTNTVYSDSESDANQVFEFTVTLGDRLIRGTYGGMTFENGVATFSLTNGGSMTATGLPTTMTYTVTGLGVSGFQLSESTGVEGTIGNEASTATFKYIKLIDVSVAIIWNDANNQDGKRPSAVPVTLKANDEQVGSKVLNDGNEWRDKFENQPSYTPDGSPIEYSWEMPATLDYISEPTVDGHNTTLTLTYEPELHGFFGYCGQDKKETTDVDESKNVTWSIPVDDPATEDIDESKTITISGTGYMMYYNSIKNADQTWSNGAPWKAFADEIEAVVIEKGITYVGSNTFAHCPNIKSITLPAEGIYEIGPGVFADCTSLTSIDIPMSVNNIGDGAFAGCSNLATVSIGYGEATSFKIGKDVFPATTTILVRETALSGYQTAEGWSTYQIAPATRTLFAADATNKWMTWCDKYAYVKPVGVTVYTVSSVATDKVTLAEVSGGVIPAYTPVLLYREAAGGDVVTATFSAVGTAPASGYDSSSGIVEANLSNNVTLYGNPGDEFYASGNSNNIYAISDLSDTQSYVLRNGNFVAVDQDGGIGAHRCWLNVTKSTTNGARLLSINTDSESTGIETTYFTNPANSSGAWYGLDGRKLDKQPTKKGLYIYNGKKHVIK